MDRSSKTLRRVPSRISDEVSRSRSKAQESSSGRAKSASPSKKASPAKKNASPGRKAASPARKAASPGRKAASPGRKAAKKEKSPVRQVRSRSRSAGRIKKSEPPKVEPKRASPARKTASKPKSSSPSRTGLASRVKESVEKITKSLSPDIETFVRQSISRFEEVTSDVVRRSVTPRTTESFSVSTRSSLRLRGSNNVEKPKDDENSQDEKPVKNHLGNKNQIEKVISSGKLKMLYSGLHVLLALALTALIISAHVLCTRNDCRLVNPNFEKFLNYKVFFDQYIWPAFTVSLLVLFAYARSFNLSIKKAPYISVLGISWLLITIGALAACQFYFARLRALRLVPFITATLFHSLIIVALSANSSSLFGVRISSFVYRLSAVVSIIIAAWIGLAETFRTVPHLAVFLLAGIQAFNAADSLVFEPLSSQNSPLHILLLVLRPLIHTLIPVFVSANNPQISTIQLAICSLVYLGGYLVYRSSLFMKASFLSDPYSHRQLKRGYGDYAEGPWKFVRHPDLSGRLLAELGLVSFLVPNPVCIALALLAVAGTFIEAKIRDSSLEFDSSLSGRKSLIPFVY